MKKLILQSKLLIFINVNSVKCLVINWSCFFKYNFLFLVALFSAVFNTDLKAEENNQNDGVHTYITSRYHRGALLPHHNSMIYVIEDYTNGFELTYGRSRFGGDNWEKYFNYPEIGLGFFYSSFGNDQIYGEGFALYPYINYKLIRSPRFNAHTKVAMGVGYATKPFDIEDNTYNMVFGSHLNVYVNFALLFDYRIAKHWSLTLSGALNHLSNGAVKKPNHGINVLSYSLGTKYHFNPELTPRVKRAKAPNSHARELSVIGSVGRSQGTLVNPEMFWNSSLTINHLWYTSEKRAFGVGFDTFYFPAAPNVWIAYMDYDGAAFTSSDYWAAGLFLSYNVVLGPATMFANLGAYVRTGITPPQPVYPRLGIKYNLNDHIVANFSVKASFFRSEFLEFGLGYRLKYR